MTDHVELWRLKQLALISQVATQVTSIYALDELLVRVVGLIYQTFEFYGVSIFILEDQILRLKAQAGPGGTYRAEEAFIPTQKMEIPIGQGIIGWVAAEGQEMIVTDVSHEKQFRYSPQFPDTKAEIALPLKVEERLLGVLDVELDYPEDFDESDLLVLRALAGQVSMAIEDTRLFHLAQQEARISNALLKVAEATQGFSDLGHILTAIIQIPTLINEVDRCAIWLQCEEDRSFAPECAAGFSPAQAHFFRRYRIQPAKLKAVEILEETGAPIIVSDALHDSRLPATMVRGLNLEALVLLPIVAHNNLLGLMLVTFRRPAHISQDTIQLITGIAHQAAVTIESKYMYEQKAEQDRLRREMELAYNIQASLIPVHLPNLSGWQMAAFWQSAQEVSGDFYDIIEVGPDQLGLVIADVAGKGLSASLYMTLTRAFMRATAPGQSNPAAVLKRTNQLLIPDTRHGRFVSLFYAILDLQTHTLTYATAGHNPPFLMRSPGRSEAVAVRGPVLGVLPEIEPEVGQTTLQPGDGLVLYTDGATEVFDASDTLFGEERLKTTLAENWGQPPPELITTICEAVQNFRAAALPTDDLTLLILKKE